MEAIALRKRVPTAFLIARFHRVFPGLYRGGWPTPDGVIPYRLFYLMCRQMDRVEAMEELAMLRAFQVGYALARNPDGAGVKAAHRRLKNRASPPIPGDRGTADG